jgi:hypothetical protein
MSLVRRQLASCIMAVRAKNLRLAGAAPEASPRGAIAAGLLIPLAALLTPLVLACPA